MIEVRVIRGDSEPALELVAAMEADVAAEFGPMTLDWPSVVAAEEMCPPHGAYVMVVEAGAVVAGGGLRRLSDGVAEIKRMFTVPAARGRGRRLPAALEDAARRLGYSRVRLDTAASMTAARALYSDYEPIPDSGGLRPATAGLRCGLPRSYSFAVFWREKRL